MHIKLKYRFINRLQKNMQMNYLKNIAYLLLTMLLFSCIPKMANLGCESDEIIEDNFNDLQVGYSLNIPKNWQAYKDVNCTLTYSPLENTSSTNNLEWSRVYVDHVNDVKRYKQFKDVKEFAKNSVSEIKDRYKNPKVTLTEKNNDLYGTYIVLEYQINYFDKLYKISEVHFFHNNLGYKIYYSSKKNEYEKHKKDFQQIVATFKIEQ